MARLLLTLLLIGSTLSLTGCGSDRSVQQLPPGESINEDGEETQDRES